MASARERMEQVRDIVNRISPQSNAVVIEVQQLRQPLLVILLAKCTLIHYQPQQVVRWDDEVLMAAVLQAIEQSKQRRARSRTEQRGAA